jgi:uncharacterized protein YegJ (DUF2314 family)
MNAARDKARDTIDEFRRRITSPPATQSFITLKVRFEEDEHVEHMWVSDVELVGAEFRGVVANRAVKIRSVQLGQVVTVALDQVSDWMAVDDGKLVAGYTLRVIRNRMSAKERAQFDAESEFIVED